MTTLDLSHFPWLAHTSDASTGAAVHTSVRAPGLSLLPGHLAADDQASSGSSDVDEEAEAEAEDADAFDILKRRRRARRANRRRDREEARSAGRIPTLPVPDVRFEQSYLMSIQPFIHSRSEPALAQAQSQEKPSSSREKRRRVEESLALVDDPATAPSSNAMDALFSTSADERRLISIDWGSIAWITFRDQLISPLVQGALWAFAGILYTGFRGYWSAKLPRSSSQSGEGLLDRFFPSAKPQRKTSVL